jgi:hypothetical protein
MLSTGTSGAWYSDAGLTSLVYGKGGEDAYLSVGSNDDGETIPGDVHHATMGLDIPTSMVNSGSFEKMNDALGPDLSRCKAAAAGVTTARELISGLLSPTGYAIGFSGGKFTAIDPWKWPNPSDATALTVQDYAGDAGNPRSTRPRQTLRKWAPIDRLDVSARIEPVDGSHETKWRLGSTDPGAQYNRGQTQVHRIRADHLISEHASLDYGGPDWRRDFQPRWRDGFAFWGQDLSELSVSVHADDHTGLWPGDAVTITDADQVLGSAAYGVSIALGRVIRRSFNCAKEKIDLTIMMGPESDWLMYAPSAVCTEYDDGDPYILRCEDDHLGDRGGNSYDVDGFAEPSWSSEGGNATLELFQFDGTTWTGGIYGTVSSVNGAASNSYITLTGALTGATFYSDRHTIVVLRTYSTQAAWVKRWYAAICTSAGTHTGGTAGLKFRGI